MGNTAVRLYGDISTWNSNSARDMVDQLDEAARNGDVVELHIHSYGGSVTEGNVIYNAIRKCQKPVHGYIDGVAASMASIVAMGCAKIYMSENALLMIHAPAGYADGRGTLKDHNATVKVLTAMERGFIKALMGRSGKEEAVVRGWLDTDTWFSAEEAKAVGLIDELVDPIAGDVRAIPTQQATDFSVEDIYSRYTAALEPKDQQPKNQINQPMDKEKLIKTLGLVGVTAQSSDAELDAAIVAKQKADSDALAAAQKQVQDQVQAQITAAIEPLKEKITVEQRAHFEAIGAKCGLEALHAALAPYASKRTISEQLAAGAAPNGAGAASASWDFKEWQKSNPTGLEKLSRENPDAFNALYKAEFGVDAPK